MTTKKEHEHKFWPFEVYELQNYDYLIVKMACECGEVRWDIAEMRETS